MHIPFTLFNYVQIKCSRCNEFTSFDPGEKYSIIECPHCKPSQIKEETNAKRRTVKKNTKEI